MRSIVLNQKWSQITNLKIVKFLDFSTFNLCRIMSKPISKLVELEPRRVFKSRQQGEYLANGERI